MPDLGKYATEVGLAYLATVVVLVILIGATWHRSRRIRAELETAEAAARDNG